MNDEERLQKRLEDLQLLQRVADEMKKLCAKQEILERKLDELAGVLLVHKNSIDRLDEAVLGAPKAATSPASTVH